jgi:hypothetical protein
MPASNQEPRTIDLTPDVSGLIRWITDAKPQLDEEGTAQATKLFWLCTVLPHLPASQLLAVAMGTATLVNDPDAGWTAVSLEEV